MTEEIVAKNASSESAFFKSVQLRFYVENLLSENERKEIVHKNVKYASSLHLRTTVFCKLIGLFLAFVLS